MAAGVHIFYASNCFFHSASSWTSTCDVFRERRQNKKFPNETTEKSVYKSVHAHVHMSSSFTLPVVAGRSQNSKSIHTSLSSHCHRHHGPGSSSRTQNESILWIERARVHRRIHHHTGHRHRRHSQRTQWTNDQICQTKRSNARITISLESLQANRWISLNWPTVTRSKKMKRQFPR